MLYTVKTSQTGHNPMPYRALLKEQRHNKPKNSNKYKIYRKKKSLFGAIFLAVLHASDFIWVEKPLHCFVE